MHFSQLLLLVIPILAFSIPEGQPNGVYQVSYIDGDEVHTLISASNATKSVSYTDNTHSAKFRAKRDNRFACGGDSLDHGQTDYANNELDKQCGNGKEVAYGRDVYSINGCVVAYFCNFSGGTSDCVAKNRQSDSRGITATCGAYRSGWSTYAGIYSYGYEYFCRSPGSNFCGRGTEG